MTLFKTVSSLLLLVVLSLGAGAQEDGIDTRSLLKLNLSDWYWARYELGYEHVLNESTSFQLAFAGIGAAEDNNNSFYNNLTGANTMADLSLIHI